MTIVPPPTTHGKLLHPDRSCDWPSSTFVTEVPVTRPSTSRKDCRSGFDRVRGRRNVRKFQESFGQSATRSGNRKTLNTGFKFSFRTSGVWGRFGVKCSKVSTRTEPVGTEEVTGCGTGAVEEFLGPSKERIPRRHEPIEEERDLSPPEPVRTCGEGRPSEGNEGSDPLHERGHKGIRGSPLGHSSE